MLSGLAFPAAVGLVVRDAILRRYLIRAIELRIAAPNDHSSQCMPGQL